MSALDVAEPGFSAPRTAEALARRRAFSSPRTKRSSSPSLTRRRSVRSMKHLLPLALPSNCYVLPAQERPLYIQGNMAVAEPTLDECNFPELLARDLDLSNLVFAAKNMTAGPPTRNLAYDEDSWHTPATSPQPLHSPTHPPPIVRFKSAKAKAPSEKIPEDQASISSLSSASGRSFSEIEPIADVRHQSVITNATSVTGGRSSVLSQKRRHSVGHDTNASWIDFEPDLDGAEADRISIESVSIPRRPATDLGMRTDGEMRSLQRASSAKGEDRSLSNPFSDFSKPTSRTWSLQLHHQHRFGKDGQPLEPVEIVVPQRRSSLRNQFDGYTPPLLQDGATQAKEAHAKSPSTPTRIPVTRDATDDVEAVVVEDLKDEIEPWFRYVDEPRDEGAGEQTLHVPKQRQHASGPLSPTENVQTWLEDSLDSILPEDQSRRMRLPPEVLDTLRVSTTCFPETMLLCSSLSIETIRSYSRKFKHPAQERTSRLQTPPPSPKRWKWTSVLGQRRSVSSLKPRESAVQRSSSEQKPGTDTALLLTPSTSPPPWLRLRNVFPSASSHLLDSLYAHLVAYTYISSFCPSRAPNKPSMSSDGRGSTTRRSSSPERASPGSPRKSKDSKDIPRKAATLLGFVDAIGGPVPVDIASTSQAAAPTSPVQHRVVRKKSSFMDTMRASRLPPAAAVESPPLRDLQLALGRCIARLVATLRAGGETDEVTLLENEDPKASEIDPLLVRTLCEIVRCCEENIA